MSGYEYNNINDAIKDLYERGKLNEDDFEFLCSITDNTDRHDKYKWHDLKKNPDEMTWLLSECEEPTVDWLKVPVDANILVRDSEEEEWRKRHFAKYEDGTVYAWTDGQTSYTAYTYTSWEYAKLNED